MNDLDDIIDELLWATSLTESSASAVDEILHSLRKLQDTPAAEVPSEIRDVLGEIQALAEEARSDPSRRSALVALLKESFEAIEELPQRAELDEDLLAIFLGTASEGLGELEQCLLAIESGEDDDSLECAQRAIHTIKGECGVLSLHVAQELWHDAESSLQAAEDAGDPVPVDALMSAIDWYRDYLARLSDDPLCSPPDSSPVVAALSGSVGAPTEPAVESDARVSFSEELLSDETVPEFIVEGPGAPRGL